ncbi:hypothetical protein [Acidovorax sp. RAC01]|uniref:hypothetical protein n=1 Tax=Acidovorax sp. RAC01 TaxID=1842533 RepID=UPI0008586338|nr:hypothetical protein [Acidovorax sp. RAC01]AOG23284.1 hypothetical protein BSY15_3856 [Acidovorax sp. RAC01]AOG24024.1 hypothetical protein BSY15_3779 [Acidovorax sp. RAC01]
MISELIHTTGSAVTWPEAFVIVGLAFAVALVLIAWIRSCPPPACTNPLPARPLSTATFGWLFL